MLAYLQVTLYLVTFSLVILFSDINVAFFLQAEAERLKTEREDSTLEEMSRLQLAEEELKQVLLTILI